MPKLLRFFTFIITLAAVLFSQHVWADEVQMIPDRCPEPCEIGGTNVSVDYQRLTVPFRIRNGTSGDYLKLSGGNPTAQRLVEGDDSFLWILLPGPTFDQESADVSSIIHGNNFDERVYRLINLKDSNALMGIGSGGFKHVAASATFVTAGQYWLLRKNLNDRNNSEYLIYNPKATVRGSKWMFNGGGWVTINSSDASPATMPALKQIPGRNTLAVTVGADFGAAGFAWHFEEAPQPRDLARLTITSVRAITVSTGRDEDTETLMKAAKYAVEYGPMVFSAGKTIAQEAAKKLAKRAAKKATQETSKTLAEIVAKLAASKVAVSVADDIAKNIGKVLSKEVTSIAAKASIKRGLLNGTMHVAAAPFKAMFWVGKTTAKGLATGGKGLVKLGRAAVRGAPQVAKKGLIEAKALGKDLVKKGKTYTTGYLKDNPNFIRNTIASQISKKSYYLVIKPYLDEIVGRTGGLDGYVAATGPASAQKEGQSGGDLGELNKKKAQLEKEWGGNWSHFYTLTYQLAKDLRKNDQSRLKIIDLEKRLKDALGKKYTLENIDDQISKIVRFHGRLEDSGKIELLVNAQKQATYVRPFGISAENYRVCSETKTYAIPASNPPYFRMASTQNIKAVADRAKSLTDVSEDDADGWLKGGQAFLEIMLMDITPILQVITAATDEVDDDLQIRINGVSAWPGGGGEMNHRKISNFEELDVGLEYVFERGEDVTINLWELDESLTINAAEKAFRSKDDNIGNLTIPTTHLYDIEEYNGTYIQDTDEGSLYEISFFIEPLYVSTHTERVRKQLHDVECALIVKQAKAEDFAREVEKTRIEGRLALLEKFDEGAIYTYDNTVKWADFQGCPDFNDYNKALLGEWRVGRYHANGNKDRRVTWTNTFGYDDKSWDVGGTIATPSGEGRWREDSLSPGRHTNKLVRNSGDWRTDGWQPGKFERAAYQDTKKTKDTCEIYAAMYDEKGYLGGKGREVRPEPIIYVSATNSNPGNPGNPSYEKSKRGTIYKRRPSNWKSKDAPDWEETRRIVNPHPDKTLHEIKQELSFAMRGGMSGSEFQGELNRIADPSTKAYKAVEFLKYYYADLPKQKDGVDANLALSASGPAELWLEKINVVSGSKRAEINRDESQDIIYKIKEKITGSWEIAPYKKDTAYPQRANPDHKQVWTFTSDGVFALKPEHDYWFTPPIIGTWEYIGDQRIEVTTKTPVKMPVDGVETHNPKKYDPARFVAKGNWNSKQYKGKSSTFIVKMEHRANDPTVFTGFYVQNSSGAKAIWGKAIHPGKTPYDVPELYSDNFLELLGTRSSEFGGDPARAAYLERRKSDKVAMSSVLAGLEFAKNKSPCNIGNPDFSDFSHPGNTAFEGKWRVGQYNSRGEKQFNWNYRKMRSPYRNIEEWGKFRTADVTFADDPLWAYVWDSQDPRFKELSVGTYEQEWVFRSKEWISKQSRSTIWDFQADAIEKVYVRTRIGRKFEKAIPYSKGDLAPPFAYFNEVQFDKDKDEFVTSMDGKWLQSNERDSFKISYDGVNCNSTNVTLPDFEKGPRKYQTNFIYRENGDKEFYITKADGSLYLWGMQETDKTKYTYKYDNKMLTPHQAANECDREISYLDADTRFPFSYADENIRKGGTFIFQNNGLKPLRIFRRAENVYKTYQIRTLHPGGYAEFVSEPGEKVAILDDRKEIRYIDRYEACIGMEKVGLGDNLGLSFYNFGEGFIRTPKITTAIEATKSCNSSLSPDGWAGRLAVVEFKNNGSTPLDIYRVDAGSRKIQPDGKARIIDSNANHDPKVGFDYRKYYDSVKPIVTLEPWGSYTLNTRVGYSFKAIKRGDQVLEPRWSEEKKKVDYYTKGDLEICFANIKVSEPLEEITVGDGLSREEADRIEKERKRKEKEDKILTDTGCVDFGKAISAKTGRSIEGAAHVVNTGGSDLTVHWIDYAGNYDLANSVMTVKPGQTGKIIDNLSAKYQVLDNDKKCAGIISPQFMSEFNEVRKTFTYGDKSVPVTGDIIDPHQVAGLKRAVQPTKHQLANGCSLYGNIASKPSGSGRMVKTIVNAGMTPLTVQWLSFYGQLQNREDERTSKPTWTLDPGASATFDREIAGVNDVFAVVEEDGQCVAVVQDTDLFVEDSEVQSRVSKKLGQVYKKYYALRDRKSAAEFDIRVAQWNLDKQTHKEKLAELETLWAASNCGEGGSQTDQFGKTTVHNDFGELQGRWEVGSYDQGAREQQFDASPTFWTFTPPFHIKGEVAGEPFAKGALPSNCMIDNNGPPVDNLKFIFKLDGTKEFFSAYDNLPEVLYSDGTIDRPSMRRQVEATHSSNVRIEVQPHLYLWGRKLPSISKLADLNGATNEVDEDASIGASVGITAGATDPDDKISYSFAEGYGPSAELFAIDPDSGVVTVAAALDYDTAKNHNILIRATSSDTSISQLSLEIAVKAINEFSIGEIVDADDAVYSNYVNGWSGVEDHVNENAEIGARTGITAQAIDADGNDTIIYNLSEDAGGLFAVDPATGVITVAGKLDWETVQSHAIEVTATSSDGSSSQEQFEIILEDISEFEVGELEDIDPNANVLDETAQIGTEVGVTAFATDADGTATVSYSIYDNRNGSAFKIDAKTGVLTLNTDLNREHYDDITINVRATSSDRSTSEKTFTIAINDVNEFGVSEIINGDWRPIGVSEDAEIGARIFLDAEAHDADATDEVTFSFANIEDVPFVIDPKTGEVTVGSKSLNDSEITSYTLEIVASSTDGSETRKSFVVPVRDINEFGVSELVDTNDASNVIDENAAEGALVGITVFAEDSDGSDEVTYSLDGSFGPFQIDAKTGVITANRPDDLDTETKPVEIINAIATSTDGSKNWFDFEVNVNDINEHDVDRPFDADKAPNEIEENAPVGTYVGITALAEDYDASDTVTYRMTRDEDGWIYSERNDLFSIDPDTGVITVAGLIDYEIYSSRLSVSVFAMSSGADTPDKSSFNDPTSSFEIKILPVNEFDLTPFVDTDDAPNEVSFSAEKYDAVGVTLTTSDADEGNYKYKFEIVDAQGNGYWDGPFNMDGDIGRIEVNDPKILIELESGPHMLHVKAISDDGSERTEEITINIIVPDKWYDNPQGPRVEADFPKVTDADRATCVAADDNRNAPATYNNEVAYFDCMESYVPVRWYNNPQGPRVEADYPAMSDVDRNVCVAVDDNLNSPNYNNEGAYFYCFEAALRAQVKWYRAPEGPRNEANYPTVLESDREICRGVDQNINSASFNNENAYFDCLDEHVPAVVRWYDNPQGPRVEADYPTVSEADRNICISADDDVFAPDTFNNEKVYFDCLASYIPIELAPEVNLWRDNPQGPRYEEDYAAVAQDALDYCRYNDEEPTSATYNNENAYFDCLTPYLPADVVNDPVQEPITPYVNLWRDNPQGPRYEEDYAAIAQDALDYCRYNDEEPTSATYNNENAYFDCLTPYLPADIVNDPVQEPITPYVNLWRDNPQGPRYEEDYAAVAQDALDYCRYNDEEPTSATYNNENAYFDCLTPYLPTATPTTDVVDDPVQQPESPPVDQVVNDAPLCASQYGLEAEYSDQTGLLTLINNSADYVEVHQINAYGASAQLMYLELGQSTEITAPRRSVHVGFDPNGNCIGAGKMRESRATITFGD